jgi:hypothetical protein
VANTRLPPRPQRRPVTATPTGTLLRCQTGNLDWFAYVLLSLRCSVVVHEPPELHAALAHLATSLACKTITSDESPLTLT